MLFEGVFRVNQNNRKRAFVSVNDFIVDVMIDDLMSQNRALDGDTVIISLLDPLYWVSYKTNNIVISKSGK